MTPSIPENTAIPITRRISAPAPLARMSGTTPAMNAKEVIRIGRRRIRAASSAAAKRSRPCRSRSRANSTIRMAFLHASPTSTSNPIWVKTLLSPRVSQTPAIADTRHIGTISTMTRGSDQLS